MKKPVTIGIMGGGSSGLFSAIHLSQLLKHQNNINIVIFEAKDRVGKKLLATGNGRCNIGNTKTNIGKYHGNNISAIEPVLSNFSTNKMIDYFNKLGIMVVEEDNGKLYPMSLQANTVVDMLRFWCDKLAVSTITNKQITAIKPTKKGYLLDDVLCDYVIIASGGLTASKLGGGNSGYKILEALGHTKTKLYPSIVQLKSDNPCTKWLKGVKFNGVANLYRDNKMIRSEMDEILFTEYGISGPAILQLSGEATPYLDNSQVTIKLDILPQFSYEELLDILISRQKTLSFLTMADFLSGIVNKKLVQGIIKTLSINLNSEVLEITYKDLTNIARLLKEFPINITGDMGFEHGQVTHGGISLDEVDLNTMESKICKKIYLVGEILDVAGDCGGFNLQWAWSSSYLAGNSIANELEKK